MPDQDDKTDETSKNDGSQLPNGKEAADLARAKLATIFGDPTIAPKNYQASQQTVPPQTLQPIPSQPQYTQTPRIDRPESLVAQPPVAAPGLSIPQATAEFRLPTHDDIAPKNSKPAQALPQQAPITHTPEALHPGSTVTTPVVTQQPPAQYNPVPPQPSLNDRLSAPTTATFLSEDAAQQNQIGHIGKNSQKNKKGRGKWRTIAGMVTTFLIVLLIFQNQVIIGQVEYYTSPGSRVDIPEITEITSNESVGAESLIIIPKINVKVPVRYDVDTRSEEAIQAALENGAVHYSGTGMPGKIGNNVILGHSSNNFWNAGNFKTAFALLDRLEKDDTFEIHYQSKRYVYQVYEKVVIDPTDFSVIENTVKEPVVTLITCTPPGTSWKRLVIQARQISPKPDSTEQSKEVEKVETQSSILPSNAPSLWKNLVKKVFGN